MVNRLSSFPLRLTCPRDFSALGNFPHRLRLLALTCPNRRQSGRFSIKITLHLTAAFGDQTFGLAFALHTFRRCLHAQAAGEVDDRTHDGAAVFAGVDFADEAAINLDLVEGKGAQIV